MDRRLVHGQVGVAWTMTLGIRNDRGRGRPPLYPRRSL
ncbi:MAG: PTS sugar transporter subunit IIB [Clostridiales bacterium]|nr:PTS sugar transporter subunit IIB [Clostridiales bacterium]